MQTKGLLVNFILVQFKEGLKIQSPHQNNKPPTPPPPPPKKGGGLYKCIQLFQLTLSDQNKAKRQDCNVLWDYFYE